MTCTTSCYYSFKIFLLYKNVRTTHHNQLLSTKFKLKELCDTSTGDVNRAAKSPNDCTVNREDLGMRLSCFGTKCKLPEHSTCFKEEIGELLA